MARPSRQYVCQSCGSIALQWSGRCEGCHEWNTLVMETVEPAQKQRARAGAGVELVSLDAPPEAVTRFLSRSSEFDRVAGGGLVPGGVVLVGGDPGIGKSTLLLQIAAQLSTVHRVIYFSGEEAASQIRLRATRLGVASAPLALAASTNMHDILASLEEGNVDVAIIDSIQTMALSDIDAAPGSVSQVRACAHLLIQLAKKKNITIILVGHVTKEGVLAGPRVLEHMVDTVLYFEGDRGYHFRILRSVKNRFGATDEIGVFEMTAAGLQEVPNPSALFLSSRTSPVSGAVVFAGIEGTRPILAEIQALVTPTAVPSPRRAVVGWDPQRLAMVLAVLETRCRIPLSGRDVYLSVAGGLKIQEPAADLAVAVALLSSFYDEPMDSNRVVFGEMGLTGEIRSVSQPLARLKEAAKLGFSGAILPSLKGQSEVSGMSLQTVETVQNLLHVLDLDASSPQRGGAHA